MFSINNTETSRTNGSPILPSTEAQNLSTIIPTQLVSLQGTGSMETKEVVQLPSDTALLCSAEEYFLTTCPEIIAPFESLKKYGIASQKDLQLLSEATTEISMLEEMLSQSQKAISSLPEQSSPHHVYENIICPIKENIETILAQLTMASECPILGFDLGSDMQPILRILKEHLEKLNQCTPTQLKNHEKVQAELIAPFVKCVHSLKGTKQQQLIAEIKFFSTQFDMRNICLALNKHGCFTLVDLQTKLGCQSADFYQLHNICSSLLPVSEAEEEIGEPETVKTLLQDRECEVPTPLPRELWTILSILGKNPKALSETCFCFYGIDDKINTQLMNEYQSTPALKPICEYVSELYPEVTPKQFVTLVKTYIECLANLPKSDQYCSASELAEMLQSANKFMPNKSPIFVNFTKFWMQNNPSFKEIPIQLQVELFKHYVLDLNYNEPGMYRHNEINNIVDCLTSTPPCLLKLPPQILRLVLLKEQTLPPGKVRSACLALQNFRWRTDYHMFALFKHIGHHLAKEPMCGKKYFAMHLEGYGPHFQIIACKAAMAEHFIDEMSLLVQQGDMRGLLNMHNLLEEQFGANAVNQLHGLIYNICKAKQIDTKGLRYFGRDALFNNNGLSIPHELKIQALNELKQSIMKRLFHSAEVEYNASTW